MKYIWVVARYIDSQEELISFHATKEGATLATQKAWAEHDETCLSEAQLKRYREWKNTKDSFSCKFVDDDIAYEYRADREELKR